MAENQVQTSSSSSPHDNKDPKATTTTKRDSKPGVKIPVTKVPRAHVGNVDPPVENAQIFSTASGYVPRGIHGHPLSSMFPCWAGSLCMGTTIGYTLPAGRSFVYNIAEGTTDISHAQLFWFASLMSLGAVFGCLAGAPLTQLCGRRWSFVGASLFLIASWLTVVRVQQTFFLYTARFVTGFFTGLISLIVPAHIAEMAVATKRGSHVALHQLMITLGILYSYVFGRFLDWGWLAWCCSLPPLLMLFLTSLIVESPRWLLQKNKKKLAVLSLIRVRPRKAQAEVEFKAIEATFPRYRTPIPHYLVALLVMVVQQLSGVNTMILSTTTNLAGLDLGASSLDSLILLSVVQSLAAAPASTVMDSLGRRTMFISSVVMCTGSLLALGYVYDFLAPPLPTSESPSAPATNEAADDSPSFILSPLTITLKAIFVAGYSAGLGPVPWMLAAELTPLRGSGLEMGTVCALNWTGVFATATLLSEVTSAKLVALTLWVHGGLTAAGGALAYTLMPETANLSIEAVLKLRQVGQKYRRKGSSKKRPDSDAGKSDARPKLQNESAEEKTSPQEPAIDSTDEQAERRTRSQEPTEGSKASTMSTPLREPKDGADTKGDDASPGSGSAADADRTDRTTPSPSGTSEPPSKKSLTDGALCYPCCKAAPVANSKGPEGAKRRRHSVASGKSTMTKGESITLTASRSASGASGMKVPDAIAGSENPPGTGGHECSVASRKSTTSRPSTYSKTNAKKKRPSDSTVTETSVKTKDRSSISGTNPDRPSSAAAALGQGSSEGKSRQVTRRRAVEATTSSAASSYRSARQAM